MATEAGMGSLEEQAVQRRNKLRSLRERKNEQQSEPDSNKPRLKFRSYNPQTEELRERKLPKGKPENVDPQIKEQLEAAKTADLGDINLANLAPKKVDWDLKRDIAKKLERLERKTQKAIVELIREKLQEEEEGEGEEGTLASAVAVAGPDQERDGDDSD